LRIASIINIGNIIISKCRSSTRAAASTREKWQQDTQDAKS